MNILFYYSSSIDPIQGGIQRVTHFLGEYLSKNNYTIYYLSSKVTSDKYIHNQYYLPNRRKRDTIENKTFYTNFIQEKKINLVVNQSGISPTHKEIIDWTSELSPKLITVIHNSLFGMYGAAQHLSSGNNLIQAITNPIFHILFKIKYGKMYKNMALKSDQIITLSDKFYDEILYYCGKKNLYNKLYYISNPITLDVQKLTEAKEVVLFVGRLSWQKRVDLLVKIWGHICEEHPNWELLIVGDGEERGKIEEIISEYDINRVRILGRKDPNIYYEKASIFCMTSAYEGFGLVLVEAMAHKIVPIAFNSYVNVSDIIDNTNNGFLVSPFNIKEYAERLALLIKDKELRNRMANEALESSKKYDIEKIGKEWINLFERVL